MHIIDIATEQTTALTDLIMGLVVVGVFIYLFRLRSSANTVKLRIWLVMFGFLGVASLIGVAAHGLAISPQTKYWLWQPINLTLGLVIAMFVAATVYEIWGDAMYRKAQWPLIGVAVLFYAITVLIPGTFLPFIAYEAVAMLFALAGYMYLTTRKQLNGGWWLVIGIAVTILAAVIQAAGKDGNVIILGLDHNGVFHLVQIFGVLALLIGLRFSLAKVALLPRSHELASKTR